MNKVIPISIGIIMIVMSAGGIYLIQNPSEVTTMDVPEDLLYVQINGQIKPYETPLNAPQSDNEPEFILIPDKNYQDIQGAVQIALYNIKQLPENLQHVQVS